MNGKRRYIKGSVIIAVHTQSASDQIYVFSLLVLFGAAMDLKASELHTVSDIEEILLTMRVIRELKSCLHGENKWQFCRKILSWNVIKPVSWIIARNVSKIDNVKYYNTLKKY